MTCPHISIDMTGRCFACGHVNDAHRARTEAEQREHAERDAARKAAMVKALTVVHFDESAAVELVTSGGAWGVRLDGEEIRWAAGPIEAMGNYCEHVSEDRKLDKAERRPVAGWVEFAGNYYLSTSAVFARVTPISGSWTLYGGSFTEKRWESGRCRQIRPWHKAASVASGMLAAEDALAAIEAEIAAVLR